MAWDKISSDNIMYRWKTYFELQDGEGKPFSHLSPFSVPQNNKVNKKQKFRFTFDDTRRDICNLELEFLKTEKWQKDGRNGKESQTSSCNTGIQRTPENIKALGTTGDRWGRRLRSRGFRRKSVQGVIAPQIPIPFPLDRKPDLPSFPSSHKTRRSSSGRSKPKDCQTQV